jgi:outer membrane murein-binding lipoprotein Lpp
LKQATKEFNQCKKKLDELNAEKSTLTERIEALQAERSAAVRALAGGDQTKRKLVADIEAKIAPLSLDLEALGHLVVEAEAKVAVATENLEEARTEYEKELARFIADREREELAKLRASLPERKQRLLDLYASFLEELGRFQVDSFQWVNGQQMPVQEIADITGRIQGTLHETLKAKGLRPLMMAGYTGSVAVWSHIRLDPDIAAARPGSGPVNALEIAKAMRGKRIAEFTKEFENEYKD